jgi:superfamily I DNA/RNA helicase
MIKKIFGPPGTGKTTTLLNLVDEYIKKGTSLNRIGYFAFTRKAANEAKERMLDKHPDLNKKDLRYFQTLHSFAFHTLGMSEENVMQPVHYEQIGRELNLRVTDSGDESLGHIYLNYNHFKKQFVLDDFNDMIEKFVLQKEKCREFEVSNVIVSRIHTRKQKEYFAKKGSPGNVEPIFSMDHIDFTKHNWLILTRTVYRSDEISKYLREKNLYFKNRFGKSFNTRLYKSIINFGHLCKGSSISLNDAKELYEYIPNNPKFKDNKALYKLEDFGYQPDDLWYKIFVKADQEECFYIRTMLSNNERLSQSARIEVSTIHAAKGGECDNVILVLDNARKIRESVENNIEKADEEHRVWYVGATRAKENLYLLKPKKERYGYQL